VRAVAHSGGGAVAASDSGLAPMVVAAPSIELGFGTGRFCRVRRRISADGGGGTKYRVRVQDCVGGFVAGDNRGG
jgi:hypothetical protein